jgi:TPP-dependent pyruvate/acetoin dehydrogenase alpha subunit
LEEGILTDELMERIEREGVAEMEEAERFAIESPYPDPSRLPEIVYAP